MFRSDFEMIKNRCAAWLARRGATTLNSSRIKKHANLVDKDFCEALKEASTKRSLFQYQDAFCSTCEATGIDIGTLSNEFMEWSVQVLTHRPSPHGWDQVPISPNQAILDTIDLLNRLSDEKDLLFIGDDDFHSLLLSRLAPDLRIRVLDVDVRVVREITCVAERYKLNVVADVYDVCEELPAHLTGNFDMFYTDPPYNYEGLSLFIIRGLQALRSHRGAWGAVAAPFCHLPLTVRDCIREIERLIIENGCVLTEIRPVFKQFIHEKGIMAGMLYFERLMGNSVISPQNIDKEKLYEHFF